MGSLANSASGTSVTVTYTPNATGTHSAQVNITDGCLPAAGYRVYLKAQCLPKPTLTKLTARDATDVTDSTYVAHWDLQPEDETVDYYIVTVKRYKNGVVTTSEQIAETNELPIEGFNEGDYDTYAVQSVRLEERSPISDYITVDHQAGIEDIIADQPLVIESHPGFIRFRCSTPHTGVRIYDLAGRTFGILPLVEDYQEMTLPVGVYFIATDEHPRPVKVIAH